MKMNEREFWNCWSEYFIGKHYSEASVTYMEKWLRQWSDWRKNNGEMEIEKAFETWVRKFSQKPDIRDWQVGQMVESIRIAHQEILNQKWALGVDWDLWKYRFLELNENHVTIARAEGIQRVEIWCEQNDISGKMREWILATTISMREKHLAWSTEKTYISWLKQFLTSRSDQETTPTAEEIGKWINNLILQRHLSATSQKQALNALHYFARHILNLEDLEYGVEFKASGKSRNIIVVTPEEFRMLSDATPSPYKLIMELLYGSGLRLMECMRLRVKDLDFGNGWILVYGGKGNKDRKTLLPQKLEQSLKHQLEIARDFFGSSLFPVGSI